MTHLVSTTQELVGGSYTFAVDPVENDIIKTGGYYTVGDNGAGTFLVRAKTDPNEEADEVFTYAVGTLIAELQITNESVNIDQLGAKGDGVIPDNYVHSSLSVLSTPNVNATDNTSFIQAAFGNNSIQRIVFSAGKNYVIRSNMVFQRSVIFEGDEYKTGQNAKILHLVQSSNDAFYLSQNVDANFLNISIYSFSLKSVIGCYSKNNLTVQNTTIYSIGDGIHFYEMSSPYYSHTANVRDSRLVVGRYGVYCASMTDSVFNNLDIYPCYSSILAGIYFFADNERNRFCNISICGCEQNDRQGTGISVGYSSYNDKNLFDNIHVRNVNIALATGSMDTVFTHITAENWNTAISVGFTEKAIVSDSYFLNGGNRAIEFSSMQYKEMTIENCVFETNAAWMNIHPGPFLNDKAFFLCQSCVFRLAGATNPETVTSLIRTTGKLKGAFSDCIFEVRDYPLDVTHTEGNAALFCFTSQNGTLKQDWLFDRCRFVNRTTAAETMNSPVRVDAENRTDISVFFRSCTLVGFRWTMRISTANETQACVTGEQVTPVIINPAFSGWPTSADVAAAIDRFAELQAFGAVENGYVLLDAQNGSMYKPAETYGISN